MIGLHLLLLFFEHPVEDLPLHIFVRKDSPEFLQLFRILALGKPELQVTAGGVLLRKMPAEPPVVPLSVCSGIRVSCFF